MPAPPRPSAAGSSPDVSGTRVLVLGGTGFLGGQAVRCLAAAGAAVTSVSRGGPPPQSPQAAGGVEGVGSVEGVALDLAACSPGELRAFFAARAPDAVVNAAGQVWGDQASMAGLNDRLAAAVVAALGPGVRLVHVGSSFEYGPLPGPLPVHETRRPAPDTVYAATKLAGTRHVLRACRSGRLDGVVLRVAVVSGPGAPGAGLLGSVAAWLTDRRAQAPPPGGHVLRLGPLLAARDFVDVRDVADAVLRAVAAPARAVRGRVVNIGGGRAVPVRHLVERLVELSGLPARLESAGATGTAGRSTAAWQQLDIDRARRLLGWAPRHALDQSLRDMLAALAPAGVHHATQAADRCELEER